MNMLGREVVENYAYRSAPRQTYNLKVDSDRANFIGQSEVKTYKKNRGTCQISKITNAVSSVKIGRRPLYL